MGEWIGVISGILAIGGVTITLCNKYLIPYWKKKIYEPIDPLQPIKKDALEYKDVPNAITLLTEKISSKHPDVMLGVERGGAIVGGILAKHFHVPIRLLCRTESEEWFRSDFDSSELDGKVVVLVDDVSRTGRSLEKAISYAKNHFNPKCLIVVALLITKTEYHIHKEIDPSVLVDYFAYFTTRTDVKLPWEKGK